MSKSWSQVAQNVPGAGSGGKVGSGGAAKNSVLDDAPALPTATAPSVPPAKLAKKEPRPANVWKGTLSSDAQEAQSKLEASPELATSPALPATAAPAPVARPVATVVGQRGGRGPRRAEDTASAPTTDAPAAAAVEARPGRGRGRQPPAYDANAPVPEWLPKVEMVEGRDAVTDILAVEPARASLTPAEVVSVSKRMSQILRHGAAQDGLPMSVNGFVSLTALLSHPRFKQVTRATVAKVTIENEKQRFTMAYGRDGEIYVRANQGHSMPGLEIEMQRLTDPDECPIAYHGTRMSVWPLIAKSGLNRMGRHHVHMAVDVPGSQKVISGARASSDCIVVVDIAAMVRDGIEVLVSANGVVLSSGIDGVIPVKYFKRVYDRDGVDLWEPAKQRSLAREADAA